jgi:CBS domain containing-hemolysin-like protein
LVIAAGGLLLILLLSATIGVTLRHHSRVRMWETLRAAGREHLMDRLVESQGDLALCVATLRTACSLALVLVLLRLCEISFIDSVWTRYLVGFGIALALVLVFGVAIPAAWAKYRGEALLAATVPFLLYLPKVFSPLVYVLSFFDSLVRRLSGVPLHDEDDAAARHGRELLDAVSEGEKLGAVDEEEKEMIESVMDLRDTDVAEIMTPRTEIEAVEKAASLTEIKDLIRRIGHSRIPIFDETIDRVVGIIYAKDLLHMESTAEFKSTDAMRTALFIPESKNLRDLLHEFQNQKVHMAIVLDEYGGTAGLVTIEDILEELVGEIADEYDPDEPAAMTRIDENTVDIDARMRVDELNERLDIHIPETEDYDTIGGFVFSTMGRIPTAGEQCAYDLVEIKVIDAEPRRINRLRLHVQRNARNNEHVEQ